MKTKAKLLLLSLVTLAMGLPRPAQAATALTNALVVHLTFDNTYNDASGNGNNASPVNAPTFTTGMLGDAVHLTTKSDGSVTNTVTLGYPAQLKFGSDATGDTTDFSMSFWVKIFAHEADQPFMGNKDWDSGGNLGWVINNEGDGVKWNWKDDVNSRRDSPHVAPQLEDGNWHNVVVTFVRTNNASIYVDGNLANQTSIAPDVVGGVPNAVGSVDTDSLGWSVNLGDDGRGNYAIRDGAGLDMLMDDVGIWRRALTAVEAARIYLGGVAGQDLGNITVVVPPKVVSTSPAANTAGVAGNAAVSAVIEDGDTQVAAGTIQMTIDGSTVTPAVSKTNDLTTVTYLPTSFYSPNSLHTAQLIFADTATPANHVTNTWSFTVLDYGVLPVSFAQATGTVLTNAPGFRLRVSQIDSTAVGVLPGQNTAHAEAQLAGLLADPATGALYANIVPVGPLSDGSYPVTNVLNFSFDGTDQGNFTSANGYTESTIPGVSANGDNLAVECLTYLKLTPGYYRFGVSSSDGFRVTVGPDARSAFATQVGIFDTFRTTGDTTFDFVVQQAGFYYFRIVWFRHSDLADNDSSMASFEFYTVTPTGQKILVNDTSNSQAVLAYQNSSASYPPYVRYAGPTAFISDYRGADFGMPSVQVQIPDGATATSAPSDISLSVDGAKVTASVTNANGMTLATYTPGGLQLPRTTHTALLTFVAGGATYTNTWQFNGLRNYVLPAPLYYENFDSTAEGSLPTNWVQVNYTDPLSNTNIDYTDPNSNAYLGWIVATTTDVGGFSGGNLRLMVAPDQELNGQFFNANTFPLMSNNFLYAESDHRGGNQVQYLYTPSYNLTGKPGVVIAFNSSYEQNQDDIVALEYTVDHGTNWLPILYWVQGDSDDQAPPDVLRDPNGIVDAVATLTTRYGDVAVYTDPATGQQAGGYYGAFIKAPISQALAPYIEGRINDDPVESKRIEVFRVPNADNQASVQFRFAQAGTGSWYWGVDDWGIYSVPSIVVTPTGPGSLAASLRAGNLVVSWTGAANVQLQSNTGLSAAGWQNVPGTLGANGYTNTVSATTFYRLIQQ
ncbi:MAG: hypothetical protein KGS61_07240 [Verrucomicrobia bacterium]|nr:hypothetical protein [Verrucomicrobiota bacterium]